MAKPTKSAPERIQSVRTRRAYFDCRFGQLHVRTAFPTTGGFDEGTTLLCLHPGEASSRLFERFLPELATDRSVYAPDLPGRGESDAAPTLSVGDAAGAIVDLASDLRLRQIDVLGFRFGARVAFELAVSKPELVRRLILVAPPPVDNLTVVTQDCLVMRVKSGGNDDTQWAQRTLARARFIDLTDYDLTNRGDDLFDAAPQALSKQIGEFLRSAP